jgi:hypothetical protein
MVKYELAVELDELDVLSVEFGGDARLVKLGDVGEFLGNVDFGHGSLGAAVCCALNGWCISVAGCREFDHG